MKKKLWLSPPHMNGEELKYIHEAFESNWVAPLGPNVDGFEKEMCAYLGTGHAAAVVSGTAAIHLALIILDVSEGDEVLCQSFTFSGSANPIAYQQAAPVFIDSETDSWNIDPQLLEQAIKDRINKGKKPKALILVHLYGQPAKLDEITQICNQYEIPIIEDAAEALGSLYKNIPVGTFGRFGILSFNGNKIITTSGGGMLISSEKNIKEARFLSTQAQDEAPHYQHSQIGYNYRMSNIIAGIGRGQLKSLDKRVERKREIFDYYKEELKQLPGVQSQPELPNTKSNRWLTTLTIDPTLAGTDREKIRLSFVAENIDTRPLWKPMHLQPVFKDAIKYENGVSEKLFNNGLCLPSGTAMTEADLNRVVKIFKSNF
ncbi:MAG: aminotransferase class I/II-fold pyridoxal phosphate-dependent enzyme [Calditrichaceae bacterium]|nr:aminotransferase class I/II-fold pyridoxal phosphate-dependent enzyme [Calditrichaceae bacterium]